jgi:chromosome segregation protein
MLLWRRWREADAAVAEAEAAMRGRIVAVSQAEGAARRATAARGAAEDALPPLREEETVAAAVVQRLAVEAAQAAEAEGRARGAIDAIRSRLAQMDKDAEREAGLNRDAAETIARLESEIAALEAAGDGEAGRIDDAAEAARAAAADLGTREAGLSAATEEAARLAARHQSAARLVADTRAALARAGAEADRARQVVAASEAARDTAAQTQGQAEAAQAAALRLAAETEAALADTESARAATQDRESAARAARAQAEGEAQALRAEVTALARLVEREAQAGTQLLDALRVTPGWEAALGAALGDDLRAPFAGGRSGWTALPPYDSDAGLPGEAAPLAAHVDGPPVLARRLAQVGVVARDRGAALQAALRPGQRLVSREGDLWRWDGFRAAAEDAPQAAALRLRQLNRLVQLKRDLEEVAARADGARLAHDQLTRRLADLAQADRLAREARRAADAKVAEAARALSRAEADRSIAAARAESAAQAVLRFDEEAVQARALLAEAEKAAAELPPLEAARALAEAEKAAVEAARILLVSRRTAEAEARREAEARARRRAEAGKDLASWRQRRETAEARAQDLDARRAQAEADLQAARNRPADLAARRLKLAEALAEAEARKARAADALSAAEAALREAAAAEREAERAAGEAREDKARAETRTDAARQARAAAAARIAEDMDLSPDGLLSALGDPGAIPAAEALDTEVQRLRRAREALGAVNLRAEEDLAEVGGEHDRLALEKGDLEAAIAKLRAGIAGLNREGRERLLTAFEQVNANFATLFATLFGGGEARLVLVESDDPLEAGLEILCQPPGKKLSTLSLLSGGEQTLTALALIFGVFLTNPAPICVLDEVDAPLDDANVGRFCDLLDEMTRRTETRFLIITHHAVTMARMDRLYGVTMAEQGVSQLVSVDLSRATALVA